MVVNGVCSTYLWYNITLAAIQTSFVFTMLGWQSIQTCCVCCNFRLAALSDNLWWSSCFVILNRQLTCFSLMAKCKINNGIDSLKYVLIEWALNIFEILFVAAFLNQYIWSFLKFKEILFPKTLCDVWCYGYVIKLVRQIFLMNFVSQVSPTRIFVWLIFSGNPHHHQMSCMRS